MLFLFSNGKITPNGQYNIKQWKQELKQLQKERKEKKLNSKPYQQPPASNE
jgi:hypothetical protein